MVLHYRSVVSTWIVYSLSFYNKEVSVPIPEDRWFMALRRIGPVQWSVKTSIWVTSQATFALFVPSSMVPTVPKVVKACKAAGGLETNILNSPRTFVPMGYQRISIGI